MRARIFLLFIFVLQAFLSNAQEDEDFFYPNELGIRFGFEGDTKKGDKYFSGDKYALEYARFYAPLQGIRSGVILLRADQHNYNISIPLYWVFRTPVIIPALGGEENEDDSSWLVFFKTFSTRLQFNTGLRPGITVFNSMGNNYILPEPRKRFSCSAHADIRLVFCYKHMAIDLAPGYDFHFTPDMKGEHIHRWFFSFSSGLSLLF